MDPQQEVPQQLPEIRQLPVTFNGTGLIPPATAINYVPGAGLGFIFQYVIRRYAQS
ncbi:hypothetical protein B0H14DRAFT_3015458, partial [Mycena olivaceomarginata]